jgi:hypothetical protein
MLLAMSKTAMAAATVLMWVGREVLLQKAR